MNIWDFSRDVLVGMGLGFLVLLAIGAFRTLRDRRKKVSVDHESMPQSPVNGVAQLGITAHEVYTAMISAGFTEAQALYLVACQLTGGPR